jgi:hypothetical protein
MKLYGLYSEKHNKLMAANFSTDNLYGVLVDLSPYFGIDDVLWNTTDKSIADRICENDSVSWYNASWTSPTYNKDYYGELVVVDLNEFELNS